jgi:hypothetical protein
MGTLRPCRRNRRDRAGARVRHGTLDEPEEVRPLVHQQVGAGNPADGDRHFPIMQGEILPQFGKNLRSPAAARQAG